MEVRSRRSVVLSIRLLKSLAICSIYSGSCHAGAHDMHLSTADRRESPKATQITIIALHGRFEENGLACLKPIGSEALCRVTFRSQQQCVQTRSKQPDANPQRLADQTQRVKQELFQCVGSRSCGICTARISIRV